jgi:hypothetical protein
MTMRSSVVIEIVEHGGTPQDFDRLVNGDPEMQRTLLRWRSHLALAARAFYRQAVYGWSNSADVDRETHNRKSATRSQPIQRRPIAAQMWPHSPEPQNGSTISSPGSVSGSIHCHTPSPCCPRVRHRIRAVEPTAITRPFRCDEPHPKPASARAARVTELLYHLVSAQQNRGGYFKTERHGGLAVHDHLEFCRKLHREIARLLAAQDAIHISGGTTKAVYQVGSVGEQTAISGKVILPIDGWYVVSGRRRYDRRAMH